MNYYLPQWEIYLLFKLIKQSDQMIHRTLKIDEIAIDNHFEKDALKVIQGLKNFEDNSLLKLDNIYFSREYINHEQIKIVASTVGSSSGHYNAKGERDNTLGLGTLFNKVNKSQKLTPEELLKLATTHAGYFSSYLKFEIAYANEVKIQKILNDYIQNFIKGNLTTGSAHEPYNYEKQRDLFWEVYRSNIGRYGNKQPLKLTDIFSRENSQVFGRFWELIFALEKESFIQVLNFGYSGKYQYKIKSLNNWVLFNYDNPFIRFEALPKMINYQPSQYSELANKLLMVEQKLHNQQKMQNKSKDSSEPNKFVISVKDREIWVNEYLIGRPHAVGSNFEFFDYVRSQAPHQKITRKKLPSSDGNPMQQQVKNKSFIKILNGLGFKDAILKAFFYDRGKDSLTYRGDIITKEDLEKAGVKTSLFLKELELAHLKNSPE